MDRRKQNRPAWAKLNLPLARQIRAERAAGDSILTIARRHGLAMSTVSRIVRGRIWLDPEGDLLGDATP